MMYLINYGLDTKLNLSSVQLFAVYIGKKKGRSNLLFILVLDRHSAGGMHL